MNATLTLQINEEVVNKAIKFAEGNNTTLSGMIESYLESVIKSKSVELEITPLVESLSGVIELPKDFDYKNEYANYILEKYK
jgi:hypothetical protein